jgi:radial spoke head protein 1
MNSDDDSDTVIISPYDGEKNCLGQKHGYGEFLFPNGDLYRGCWKFNKMHGYGVYIPFYGEK